MQKVGNSLWSTVKSLFGIFSILSGSYILIQIPSLFKAEVDFKSKAISASGTVTEVKTKESFVTSGLNSYSITNFYATVRFQLHQGEHIEFTARNVCEDRLFTSAELIASDCIGENVPVLYNPADPEKARVSSAVNPTGIIIWAFILSFYLLIGGIGIILPDISERKS